MSCSGCLDSPDQADANTEGQGDRAADIGFARHVSVRIACFSSKGRTRASLVSRVHSAHFDRRIAVVRGASLAGQVLQYPGGGEAVGDGRTVSGGAASALHLRRNCNGRRHASGDFAVRRIDYNRLCDDSVSAHDQRRKDSDFGVSGVSRLSVSPLDRFAPALTESPGRARRRPGVRLPRS